MIERILNSLRSRMAAFGHDLAMIPAAWLSAHWLRFNLETIPTGHWEQALKMLPFIVLIQGATFWYFGLYRGVWRYASMPDLARIAKSVVFGVATTAIILFLITRLEAIPRSIFPLYGLLLLAFLGGPRLVYRWLKEHSLYYGSQIKVLIVGAGSAGEMLVRDLKRDTDKAYMPVAFVDDNPQRHGKEIHGVRVVGESELIPKLTEDLGIEQIMVALPSATSKQMRRIVQLCEVSGVPFRALPRMQDLVSGKASVNALREVSIDDLLGREQISLDWDLIRGGLSGKVVLVTGGGGSIGSELCRQIACLSPAKLIVLERCEYNLYEIEMELRRSFPSLVLDGVLGDCGDVILTESVMKNSRPHVVFHAAAYKHVPMLEHQGRAAVANNVLATRTVASLADKYSSEAFVMVSTDKAVNPGNVMGASKRAAEIYCQNLNSQSKTRFITVRFGNVLGSAGSVIPLFRKQIERGGPVTVTHPEITRYFMTIPEATQLILQAGAMGEGGEIFVLDMGEPIKITYLAEQMILLSGKQPGEDIEIIFTGLRPGEKLYEELFHDKEDMTGTRHPKIMQAASRTLDMKLLDDLLNQAHTACEQNDIVSILKLLDTLVPENLIAKSKAAPVADQLSNVVVDFNKR